MAQSHLSWLHRPLLLCSGALVMVRAVGFSPQGRLVWSSGSEARGIFPDQGLNLRLLPWQLDSLSLGHQESPDVFFHMRPKAKTTSEKAGKLDLTEVTF